MEKTGLSIGYDGKRAACNLTGLGNYSRYTVQAMALHYPSDRYILYTPRVTCGDRISALLSGGNVELKTPESAFGRRFGALWRTFGITDCFGADGIALYHGLSNELPLNIKRAGIASVVTIHDLIYRRVQADYSAIDRRIYDFKYRRSAENATRVIAISECTRRDLVNDHDIDPGKIDVIYQGCDPAFFNKVTQDQCDSLRVKLGLPERFIVSVGTVQSRKNQLLAVKALRGLPEDVVLAIAGGRDKKYGAEIDRYISAHRLGHRVKWLGPVSWPDLPVLYAAATFSSYTSRYEGFGIPLVESIATGTPLIAATGSCLEEAGGPGALYVDPDDVDAYVDAARRLLDDRWLRQKMVDQGARHIRKFNTGDFARKTMACYKKAIIDSLELK
ncbi:MAG: glycosyltransferase family 4 protein [Muribaculaceae bacterium]|nr:glycosyltransferase family 4 protein [Muribaculaceae bacterium]